MADSDHDAALREMAAHRGLRLVKSRRRTPGVGDYGRYGLAGAKSGDKCFGFGPDGLTATAEEIATHLRGSAAATWRASAETTPDRPKPEPAPLVPPRQAERRHPDKPRRTSPATMPKARPELEPEPTPPPEPRLTIRPAAKGDTAAIAELLRTIGATVEAAAVETHIAAQARAGTPLLVADRGGIVGCLDWTALATLHLGLVGRVTLLLVTARAQRRGIGRALIEAAIPPMRKRGCGVIEAIGDIEIRNANAFFRRTGFTQTSYRLEREI